MGDPVYREKPQLHYAVSVPARTEVTGGATPPAREGTAHARRDSWLPLKSSVGWGGVGWGAVHWRVPRVSPPECQLLRNSAAP